MALLFLLGIFKKSLASEVVIITDSTERITIMGSKLDILEDPQNRLTIKEISSLSYANKFQKPLADIPSNDHKNSSYWIRFSVKNNTAGNKKWVLEFLDFRIDELEIYESDGKDSFRLRSGGDKNRFDTKEYLHKNFIYDFDLPAHEGTYYARIRSDESVSIFAEIESHNKITSYSANEYFALALFYGTVIALGLVSIFLFATLRDRAYLYYVFYILSIGLFSMSQDGTGFQYLWPDIPQFNNYASAVGVFFMVFWVLWYARKFLFIEASFPTFNKIIYGALAIRSVLFILGLTLVPSLLYIPSVDLILMFIAYVAGILAWYKGFKPAMYYVIGFTFLFVGFLITSLHSMGLIPNTIFSVYSYDYGVVGQMFLFAFALAERVKEINKQRELAEEKNRELDIFVYKASHDITGPLKSIIGLTKVGMQDIKSPEAKNYFDLILKNTSRLDSILGDLIMVTKMKQSESKRAKINFDLMIKEILSSFEYLPSYKEMDFKVSINEEKDFYSDPTLLYSVFQNMIENAIKYKKPSSPLFQNKDRSYLHIEVEAKAEETTVVFSDNGLGIAKELQPKIFDMFFRVNNNVQGSGLGLYLVKISVEKLGGTIRVDGEENKGSVFTLRFSSNK